MTRILASDWLSVITWPGCGPLIGQDWSRDQGAGLWLDNSVGPSLWRQPPVLRLRLQECTQCTEQCTECTEHSTDTAVLLTLTIYYRPAQIPTANIYYWTQSNVEPLIGREWSRDLDTGLRLVKVIPWPLIVRGLPCDLDFGLWLGPPVTWAPVSDSDHVSWTLASDWLRSS